MKQKIKTAPKKKAERVRKNKPKPNVERATFLAWQKAKRRGDPDKLAEYLDVCRPVIDKAIKYANVSKPEHAEKITRFFNERIARENAAAQDLISVVETQEQLSKKLS